MEHTEHAQANAITLASEAVNKLLNISLSYGKFLFIKIVHISPLFLISSLTMYSSDTSLSHNFSQF